MIFEVCAVASLSREQRECNRRESNFTKIIECVEVVSTESENEGFGKMILKVDVSLLFRKLIHVRFLPGFWRIKCYSEF